MPIPGGYPLSPKLEALLDSIPNVELSERFREVYRAAALAIARLSDIDLLHYESAEAHESADLSLWEEMAPVVGKTVTDVNALLTVIEEQTADEAPIWTESDPVWADKAQRAYANVREAMRRLSGEVSELGESMRNPSVVSDKWNLLAEIQRFRTRFREEIGELVFESASLFGDVRPSEVVPGYAEEVASAVGLRGAIADLQRVALYRRKKVAESDPQDAQWHAEQLRKELDAFGRTSAFSVLRAQDKGAIIAFRQRAGALANDGKAPQSELLALVQAFSDKASELGRVNQRQILIEHDREVFAECGVLLERSQFALEADSMLAAKLLTDAVFRAVSLYGRSASLDAFLRKAKKADFVSLEGDYLGQALEELRSVLTSMDLPGS